jgi:aromatic-L-amino-acid decarboxylase
VVLNQVRLNQVVVDFGGAERNATVLERIQDDGTCWCGPTNWHGRSAMRISVSCWATAATDVEASIRAMLRSAARS